MKKKRGRGEPEKITCFVCGREISEDESEEYDGMCWECWDDQLTEESECMFGPFL
jgi:NMD protein affecting ribosome stability and mRNA decay